MELLGDMGMWKLYSFHLETILDAPDSTTSRQG
jgi:hypothetical protein